LDVLIIVAEDLVYEIRLVVGRGIIGEKVLDILRLGDICRKVLSFDYWIHLHHYFK